MATPDLPSLKEISGTYTVSGVAAGSSTEVTITIDEPVMIIGAPAISTSTANATVELVSGGKNSFVVKATNNGASAQDIVIEYTVYVINDI